MDFFYVKQGKKIRTIVGMTAVYSLFVRSMCKHSDVDLKRHVYGLARDVHVTGGPPALMVRWLLVHSLGLEVRTCGSHMWPARVPRDLQGMGYGLGQPWLVIVS